MRKFTIFTVILTIVILVVVAELFVNDYLPRIFGSADVSNLEFSLPDSLNLSDNTESNMLGADIDYSNINEPEKYEEITLGVSGIDSVDNSEDTEPEDAKIEDSLILPTDNDFLPINNEKQQNPNYPEAVSSTGLPDFEDENFSSFSRNVYIREDMIKSAGFIGAYLEKEPHNGFLFKTIYIDDLIDVEVQKTVIRTEDSLFAKVYTFKIGPMSSINEIYEVLKMRAAEGLNVEINENNEFGNNSFFMNDARRQEVAFLSVRLGSLIYSFSYPKEYHSQIKNLITLLDLEF
ncbi:hypothetical protein GF366_00685 [Candidatus Peregrinibacteria bacterium]|nr:hypothetical protein [Candidatus Peregrinibacteria bacterium]